MIRFLNTSRWCLLAITSKAWKHLIDRSLVAHFQVDGCGGLTSSRLIGKSGPITPYWKNLALTWWHPYSKKKNGCRQKLATYSVKFFIQSMVLTSRPRLLKSILKKWLKNRTWHFSVNYLPSYWACVSLAVSTWRLLVAVSRVCTLHQPSLWTDV